MLRRSEPSRNMHRFYRLSVERILFGGWSCQREWGASAVRVRCAARRTRPRMKRRRGLTDWSKRSAVVAMPKRWVGWVTRHVDHGAVLRPFGRVWNDRGFQMRGNSQQVRGGWQYLAYHMRDNAMPLQLVGETIDAKRAHLGAQAGELVPLVRGVYIEAADDIEATILGHAVRIARHLYPKAYLSSASAALLAPTSDGRLSISGRRNQRTRMRNLEIIQNEAPPHPSTTIAIVGDDLGEQRVDVSSLRQRCQSAWNSFQATASKSFHFVSPVSPVFCVV